MNVNNRSVPGPGSAVTRHTTSVDVARNTKTTVALNLAGQKRTYNEFRAPQENSMAPATITNKAIQRDFHRPSLKESCYQPLKAGDIQNFATSSHAPSQSEYTQRKVLALTPSGTANPLLDLSHASYALPKKLVQNFASLGIKSIYPWQSDCLLRSGALEGQTNLVYTAPTGGGKSLVADILILKKVIEDPEKKALLVLPYVALVQEKLRYIRKIVDGITKDVDPQNRPNANSRPNFYRNRGDENSVRVVGFFGGSKSTATWRDMDIAICTIEKANALINASIEDKSIGKLGIVVMDELHMIDDEARGYILELMATKLLSISEKVQLIGMSATLNNASLLATWLNDAKFYISKYRPVPVEEHLVFDNAVYPSSSAKSFFQTAAQLNSQASCHTQAQTQSKNTLDPIKIIQQSPCKELNSPLVNAVVSLANETVRAGYGVLVFCSSRVGCERDAVLISQVVPRPEEVDALLMKKRIDLLNDLGNTTTGLDSMLEKTVPVGVAYHHAGLTTEERDLLASAYDSGILKVIVATCSLAAGINLPARRVILHGARMGADLVGPAMLRQMRGRAGRKGKDEIGETYLCCQKSDLEAVAELMEAEIPSVVSCLVPEKRGIKRALLEVLATKLANSDDALNDYVKKTLLYHSVDRNKLSLMVKDTLEDLIQDELIQCVDSEYTVTLMGQAIVASSLTPEDGLFVHRELYKASQGFVMLGEMHVLYAFTPVQASQGTVNWQVFRKEVERLDEHNMRAMSFIGLKPTIINKMAQGGKMPEATPSELETIRIYHRFYAALQLRDLCNEMPIHAVATKYDIARGSVQSLSQTCHGFAAGMIKFSKCMDWGALASVLDHYSDRLKAGAKSDLLSLAKITHVKSRTARVFWENGFKTVALVAAASVQDIVPVLLQVQPRKIRTSGYDEERVLEKLIAKAEVILDSANRIWEMEVRAEMDAWEE